MSNQNSGVCAQCGTGISNEASFCGQCGSKVSTSDVNTQEPSRFNIKFLLLDWNGRIDRLQFLLGIICCLAFAVLFGLILGFLSSSDETIDSLATLINFVLLYPSLALLKKRAYDRGHSGWFLLCLFVPILNFGFLVYLFFAPSSVLFKEREQYN